MQRDQWDLTVLQAFRDRYGAPPTVVATAPGRVNLIGEHIDYNGLSVLPMAIQRQIRIALRPCADATVRAVSTRAGFAPCEFELDETIPPGPPGDWCNYLKAAAQEMAARYNASAGFDAVIDSSIPVAAGLSSSSALVIATATALAHVNQLDVTPLDLAAHMAEAERYVGTRGGGMDQAIGLMASPGTASRIDFDPLRATTVAMPADWRFVVAYSLAPAEKSGRMQHEYNRRTEECRAALATVAASMGMGPLQPTYRALTATHLAAELVDAAEACLAGTLLRRFRHVVTEAHRVHRAESAMRDGHGHLFGNLLDASHASLRDDYEVSTAELDAITTIAREASAHGARLTGAGMGGCAIALTPADRCGAVVDALAAGFYRSRRLGAPLADYLFVAEPSGGAAVEEIK